MENEIKYVNVKWIKAHPAFAYSAGDTGTVDAQRAPKLLKEGYIMIVPEEEKELEEKEVKPKGVRGPKAK